MTAAFEDIIQALTEGQCLISALMPDAFGLARAVQASDPDPDPAARPTFYWDPEDGLNAPGQLEIPPEGMEDLARALDYAARFAGPAIFVFDLAGVDLAEGEKAFRRQIKSMAGRFTPAERRALILAGPEPPPASIAHLCHRLGYDLEAEAAGAPSAPRRPGQPWEKVRDLAAFSTDEWRERLEHLGPEDVEDIVRGDYHQEALQRVRDLRDELKRQFAHKDEILDLMLYATVAQAPMLLLGPPGTAKSNMVRNFCEGLGLTARASDDEASTGFFEYLLTRYTTPEEIFGPVHIDDLIKKRLYRRVTTDRLPEAEMAFLDEIFKASSAIVNTLLAILNERVFHNGGQVQRVPLIMVFAASNEPPQDPQLGALYDRFPIRANCEAVEDPHVPDLWRRSWSLTHAKTFGGRRTTPHLACANDFRLLHLVSLVRFGGADVRADRGFSRLDFGAEFLRIFRSLRREYDISDRTLHVLYALARAMALVEGRDTLTVDELSVFRYVSWDESGSGDLDRLVSNLKRGISA